MKVAEVARDENCGRIEWTALDWNEPALKFYDSRGAKILEDWKILRLTQSGMEALASQVDWVGFSRFLGTRQLATGFHCLGNMEKAD